VHLGEAAQLLVTNTDYEAPYLQRAAAKQAQLIQDHERRRAECLRSAAQCAAAYREVRIERLSQACGQCPLQMYGGMCALGA
jgi:hypothetical protein